MSSLGNWKGIEFRKRESAYAEIEQADTSRELLVELYVAKQRAKGGER